MTAFRSVSPLFSVAGQIGASDILKARSQGFRKVISNRPDHEEGVDFSSNEAASLAVQNNLDYAYAPAENHLIYKDETIERFIDELRDQPGPVLAYCRSGTRCTILWALAASRFQPAQLVFDYLMSQGFEEFDILAPEMEEQSSKYLADRSAGSEIPQVLRIFKGKADLESGSSRAA